MPDQAEQTDENGAAQRGGSEDHPQPNRARTHEQTRPERVDRCQFDDFAMI